MKKFFSVTMMTLILTAASGAYAKSFVCTGVIQKNGIKTTVPQQILNFDPKQSETIDIFVKDNVTYQVWWDVSNHDGKPLLSVGYVSPTLARSAKGSASDMVMFLEMNPQTQDQTAVSCIPLGN